jgi:hypothetical protein
MRLNQLSVESVAAGLGIADSPRKPEDSLSQRLIALSRSRRLPALFLASCLALFTPLLVAQATEPASPAPVKATQSNASTPVQPPSAEPGSGGNEEQLQLALQQGKADTAVLDWVLANSGPLKGDTRAGQMRVAFTITPAEGWWDKAGGGKLAWHQAPDDNVHLRIFILDLVDGRIIPGLNVRATLTDANGNEQSAPVDFGWYPLMNAYGGNIPMDTNSSYTLRVTVDPLPSRRVIPSGSRFERTTVAVFPPVQIDPDAVADQPLATATVSNNEAELLKPCNAALSAAITALWQESASGAEKPSGDYFVGYALDYSGRAVPIGGSKLRVRNLIELTGKDNVRLELLARDSRTGRLIPGLNVQASLVAADGKLYGPGEMPLLWNSWLNHYGRDTRIPRRGEYKLRVHFDPPGFRRWGQQGDRFAAAADVEFENVSLVSASPSNASPKPEPKE